MTTAIFGDFLDQAERHLQAAAGSPSVAGDPVAAAPALLRLVSVMARYLDDRAPVYAAGVTARAADLQPWERAVADTGSALHIAADCLLQGITAARFPGQEPAGDLARRLSAAAMALTAGRDLLHTHLTTTQDDLWEHRSEWAPVMTSLPVTRAITENMSRWCGQVAAVAAQLASASGLTALGLGDLRDGLHAAVHWLWTAATAVQSARATDPVSADDVRLLRAIPAAHSPPRRPPGMDESVPELCVGVTVSAQRLRAVAFGAVARARWAAPSSDTWQWTATAAAVSGHATELILQSLPSHLDQQRGLPGHELRQHATEAMTRSWQAWRQVAASWAGLATETRGHTSPAVTEISDLVLRIGRLARDDPNWAPTRENPSTLRDWTGSVPGDHVLAAVAAVHQSADAFAQAAAADLQAVAAADNAGRLYVRTRSLPPGYDVPRRYATAPADRTAPLLDAYRTAVHASAQAAGALAVFALTTDAPSATLALARAACDPRRAQIAGTSQHPGTGAAQDRPDIPAATPGPTERAIRNLRVTDPAILLRAATIDHAAQQLITQAQPGPNRRAASQWRPAGRAAQLAAQDLPAIPATGAARSGRGNRARPTPSRPDTGQRPQSPRSTRPGSSRNTARGRAR